MNENKSAMGFGFDVAFDDIGPCIHCNQLQHTLNSWRRKHTCNKHRYKSVIFSDDNVLYLSSRDVMNGMLCLKQSSPILRKWNGALRQCVSCSKCTVPNSE